MNASLGQCNLSVNTTLPLVCVCSLFSFLCGVGIGANDLSANFAMVVGSGSLDMKSAIIYCTVFELLGAAFMGGRVSGTIRGGIVEGALFTANHDVVVIGMTAASFAAALWLYLSTVFGLPVSITHTVVGSLLGYAVFSTFSFSYVKARGLVVIVVSWLAAPLAACAVTALIFYVLRRDVFKVRGRSFELAQSVLPWCLAASLLVDFAFIVIEKPPVMTQTLARLVPVPVQFLLLLLGIGAFCYGMWRWYFPRVAVEALAASSFVWESTAVRTEAVEDPGAEHTAAADERLLRNLSLFNPPRSAAASESSSSSSSSSSGVIAPTPPTAARAVERTPLLGSSGEPPAPGSQTRGRLLPTSSVVLSSISPSDSRVVRSGTVRLAPTGRRSPAPSAASGRDSITTPRDRYLPLGTATATGSFASRPSYGAVEVGVGGGGARPLSATLVAMMPSSPASVRSGDEFGDEDWALDHPMEPIRFGGLLIKPFNPRAEYLFTSLQVVAGSMSSFVHGAVAGANATATFVILYDAFASQELGETGLGTQWAVLPAMLGIAIGMFALGASLMKTVGMELVTVTPARGWCIQVGGTAVTMVLTGLGIPVSLSQSQVGAAVGCGVLDAKLAGVSWPLVAKIVCGWVVTLVISAATTGAVMWFLFYILC